MDLVDGFDPDVGAAVQFAFGSSLVCATLDDAKTVAFDAHVKTTCVTLQGDICNPVGTLTGGSAPSATLGALLTKLYTLHGAKVDEARLEDVYDHLSQKAQALEAATRERRALTTALDIAKARLDDAVDAEAACAATVAESALETITRDLGTTEATLRSARATADEAIKEITQLEKTGADVQRQHDMMLDALRKDADRKRALFMTAVDDKNTKERRWKDIQADVDDLAAISAGEDRDLERARQDVAAAVAAWDEKQTIKVDLQRRVDADDMQRAERSKILRTQRQKIDGLRSKANVADLEAKKLTHQAARLGRDAQQAAQRRDDLVAQHPWIPQERQFFGRPGGDYDFAARPDAKAARRDLEKLAEEQDELARSINQRVMGAIEHAEKEYSDLTAKREAVKRDHAKIQTVIAELDDKKKETLETTVAKVDHDFGAIFGTLLPGARAKLVPADDTTHGNPRANVLNGLEFKVAFGSIWKQSLTELSGGQRSLVALSLVLAMLKFKPAPMYILDEVDAALDLSHTQNIGTMLKRHFQNAQFLVVSLKEGMFHNANVIFRTTFIDGVSTVTRSVNAPTTDDALPASAATATATASTSGEKDDSGQTPAAKKPRTNKRLAR